MRKYHWIFNAFTVIILAIFAWYCLMLVLQNANEQIVTVLVKDKMRVSYGHEWISQKYLIYTIDENGEVDVLEDTDSFPHMKFNSSDIYALLESGQTYTLRVVGYRIPLLSKYQNIIEIIGVVEPDNGS